jgi:hypothetical protein
MSMFNIKTGICCNTFINEVDWYYITNTCYPTYYNNIYIGYSWFGEYRKLR